MMTDKKEMTPLQVVESQLAKEKNLSDTVLNQVKVLEAKGNISVPKNYALENSLKQAWFKILETEDRNQKPALDVVDRQSVAQVLLDMVTQGLNPGKNQCYFIVYGKKLQLHRSYLGNAMMLKRDAGAVDVITQLIYDEDDFSYELDASGRIKDISHKQSLKNIDKEKIVGAYCSIIFEDESKNYTELMTMDQIEQAWMQSKMIKSKDALKNSKTHGKFRDEMARKTVINRAAKRYINTSTDEGIIEIAREIDNRQRKEVFDAEVEENQATEALDIPNDDEIIDIPNQKDEREKEPVKASQKFDGETGEIIDEDNPF